MNYQRPMKVQALALGTGYAESASWSQLFLYHETGFDSVQEAMMDIREALIGMIKQEQEDAKHSIASIRRIRGSKEVPYTDSYIQGCEDFIAATPEEALEPVLHEIIHGTYQDHGEFWEWMAGRGWDIGNAWSGEHMNTCPTVCVDSAPEAVVECVNWDEEFRLFNDPPKGIRLLKKV